jgi:hypothetical protein
MVLFQALQATAAQLRRLSVQRNRLDLARNRDDTRQWVQDRRARTRHLIELGGLVQKAGLVELVDDDRATLLGAFLELASRLQDDDVENERPADLRARWRRRGLRAFEADREAAALAATPPVMGPVDPPGSAGSAATPLGHGATR